jgi:hypothetical protein
MFNLEQAIADWRRQMLAAGIKTPVPMEELEGHLRDDVEQQMKLGSNARQAFEEAVQRIGQAPELKREFKKVSAPMEMQKIVKLAGVICVGIALFCPLFIFLPLLLDHRFFFVPKMLSVAVYATTVTTIVLSWKYNHKFLPVIRNQLVRRAVGMACYGACLLWIRFGLFRFPPGGSHPLSLLLPLLVFGLEWTVIAILGGVGRGLEKAAHTQIATIDS